MPNANTYNHAAGIRYCQEVGLDWSEQLAAQADVMAWQLDLDQAGFDQVIRWFIEIQKWQWSPRSYTARNRIALAVHFLFNPKGW